MRGVNLDLFDFDFDLTWAGFFLSPEEEIYGRYGGRDAKSADSRVSLAGLRYAMIEALKSHQRRSKILYSKSSLDSSLSGLNLDVDEGDRVRKVAVDSPASQAGIQKGDRLRSVNGVRIGSIADVQHGLHRAGTDGEIPISWLRGEKLMSACLTVARGWRKMDISWRWSLRGLEPTPWVLGEDLTPEEKAQLGLSENQLAFYQAAFLSETARQAGIRSNDMILGVDGKSLEMTARQFQAYIRLNYKVGDRVTYNLLRVGRRLDLPLTLIARPPS